MLLRTLTLLITFISLTGKVSAKGITRDHYNTRVQSERYILENKTDSALFLLEGLSKDTNYAYLNTLTDWCKNKNRNNSTIIKLVTHFSDVLEFRTLIVDEFINKYVTQPIDDNQLDSNYFQLKAYQMNHLFNIGETHKSDSIYQFISSYIDKFEQLNPDQSLDYYKFEENKYLITLAYIAKDTASFRKIHEENLEFEKQHHSTSLIITNREHQLLYLFLKHDINTYIVVAEELLNLYYNEDSTSLEYYNHHLKLIDLFVYQSEQSPSPILEEKIYNLLIKVYNSPYYQLQSLSLSYFVQFFHSYPTTSIIGQKILTLYNVDDLPQLCYKLLDQINKEENKIRITTDYNIITRALEINGYLKEALQVNRQLNNLLKERYTEDLSNSLSILKVKQEKERNKHSLQLEKNKQNYYLVLVLVLIIILTILFWASKQQKKKNLLLEKSENEKTLLLKEIHHRVKNNFQIAIGLIDLQFKDVEDVHTIELLDEWKGKIKSMIIVHQNLYQNDNLTVHLDHYIHQIIEDIKFIYSSIQCQSSIEIDSNHQLDIDTAVNLGLILNELVNNAYKYGTVNNSLNLSIKSTIKGNHVKIHFSDNGMGFANITNISENNTFGIQLIEQLIKQMNGDINYKNDNGAQVILNFKTKIK